MSESFSIQHRRGEESLGQVPSGPFAAVRRLLLPAEEIPAGHASLAGLRSLASPVGGAEHAPVGTWCPDGMDLMLASVSAPLLALSLRRAMGGAMAEKQR